MRDWLSAVTEAKKSCSLHLQTRGPREPGVWFQSQPEGPRSKGQCKSQVKSKSLRTRSSDAWGQQRTGGVAKACSPLLFYFGTQWIEPCPRALARASVFAQSTDSSANLSESTLTGTPRSNVASAIWASLSLVNLAQNLNSTETLSCCVRFSRYTLRWHCTTSSHHSSHLILFPQCPSLFHLPDY